jgi:hypothetical protein
MKSDEIELFEISGEATELATQLWRALVGRAKQIQLIALAYNTANMLAALPKDEREEVIGYHNSLARNMVALRERLAKRDAQ